MSGTDQILETERLILRKLKSEDTVLLHKILSDKKTMRFYPAPYDLKSTGMWIDKSLQSYLKNGFGLWAVIHRQTGEFIGQCGISMQHINGSHVPEIGYHIRKDQWNKGYATEAARACLHYGFETLNLNSIYIHTYIKNLPSQRIAEKLGMKKIMEYDKYLKTYDLIWPHVVYAASKE